MRVSLDIVPGPPTALALEATRRVPQKDKNFNELPQGRQAIRARVPAIVPRHGRPVR